MTINLSKAHTIGKKVYGPGTVDVPAGVGNFLAARERKGGNAGSVTSRDHARPSPANRAGRGETANSRDALPIVETRRGPGGIRYSPRAHYFVAGLKQLRKRDRVETPVFFDTNKLTKGDAVLIVRRYGMGDLLMVTPLIRHLARRGIAVSVQTDSRYVGLLKGNPHVTRAFAVNDPIDLTEFDARLCMDDYCPDPMAKETNRIRDMGKYLAIALETPADCKTDYFIEEKELSAARARLKGLPRPWFAYVWKSNGLNRNWSKPSHEQAIRDLLKTGGSVIVLCESACDAPARPQVLNLSGKTPDLRDVAALLKVSDGVVSPDTGLFHLAAAMDCHIATYFGAFPMADRISGAETRLSVINAPEVCEFAACYEFDCPFLDTDLQAPCLSPETGRVKAWAQERAQEWQATQERESAKPPEILPEKKRSAAAMPSESIP